MRRFRPEDRLSRAQEMLSTELDRGDRPDEYRCGGLLRAGRACAKHLGDLETPLTFSALVDRLVRGIPGNAGGLRGGYAAISGGDGTGRSSACGMI